MDYTWTSTSEGKLKKAKTQQQNAYLEYVEKAHSSAVYGNFHIQPASKRNNLLGIFICYGPIWFKMISVYSEL